MADTEVAKSCEYLTDVPELDTSLLEEILNDSSSFANPYPSKVSSRSTNKPKGSGRLKQGTKRIQKESETAHCGNNQSNVRNDAEAECSLEGAETENSLEFAPLPLTPDEFNQKRNAAFPHAHLKRHKKTLDLSQVAFNIPRLQPMANRSVALLVASLGNPPPYHSTRHSAGHIILNYLRANLSLPPFTPKSKNYGGGHVSLGSDASHPQFTLWQSPSLMNVSGPALLKTWGQFENIQKSLGPITGVTGLVILHDEMETEPGKLTYRTSLSGSAKGHNGIKSVQASFKGAGTLPSFGERVVRLGVGIGRPAGGSRDSRDISAYVLGQLTPREKDGLEKAAREVEQVLYEVIFKLGQS